MRALIVDDNATIRRILLRFLAPLGFEVFEAEHGGDALLQLGALGAVELVLVDWNMPLVDGLTFVRVVRAHERFAAVAIMMITTESSESRVAEALSAGVDDYDGRADPVDDLIPVTGARAPYHTRTPVQRDRLPQVPADPPTHECPPGATSIGSTFSTPPWPHPPGYDR
jgi:two-component system chemotaxis response regulator CheY